MSYEVLARKWRPQQFDEVVGQGHVTKTIGNAIASGRVAHAYLFVGPRGVGKTSIARIMAKALNCEKGPTLTPCDTCASCREIRDGRSMDVMEFDAASNTQVEKIRDVVINNVMYTPARDRFKIYLIDEVHMLSNNSFNALLKTLEEPPPHVKFIFATTDPQKVPTTILSRCQRFDLRRISTRDIVSHLEKIAKAEGVEIDPDAVLAIGRAAEGGLRDAESTLDQLMAFCGKKIKEEDVLSIFGLISRKTLETLADAVLSGRIPDVLNLVSELDSAGKDLQRASLELLEYVRNLLVILYAGRVMQDQDIPDALLASLKKQAASTEAGRLHAVADILIEVQSKMRFALSRRTVLEMALIRAARAASQVSVDELLKEVKRLKEGLPLEAPARPAARAPEAVPVSQAAHRPVARAPVTSAPLLARESAPAGSADDLARLTGCWTDIVNKVGLLAPFAKSALMDAKPLSVSQTHVVIGFDPEFADNKEKMATPRNLHALTKTLDDLLGRAVSVEFSVLAVNGAPVALPSDHPVAAPSLTVAAETPVKPAPGKPAGKTRAEWADDPAVKKTIQAFDAEIFDIRE